MTNEEAKEILCETLIKGEVVSEAYSYEFWETVRDALENVDKAYKEGYEQGRFDERVKWEEEQELEETLEPIMCKNCKYFDTNWNFCGTDVHICKHWGIGRRESEFCSSWESNK